MVRYCLEMPHGAMKHFPAGTYDKQISKWTGRRELQLMSVVHSIWYMFKHLSMMQWGANERRLAKWLMPDNTPPEPTRRLDDILAVLWGSSAFAFTVMFSLQRSADG
jgi:hypothetical protein